MAVGNRIKEARKAAGLTQIQVAQRAGIAVNTLRLYEAEKRHPRLDVIEQIASAIGVPHDVLFPSDTESILEYFQLFAEAYPPTIESRVGELMRLMNDTGKNKVLDYAEDILPRYRATEVPESPPSTTDTTAEEKPPTGP